MKDTCWNASSATFGAAAAAARFGSERDFPTGLFDGGHGYGVPLRAYPTGRARCALQDSAEMKRHQTLGAARCADCACSAGMAMAGPYGCGIHVFPENCGPTPAVGQFELVAAEMVAWASGPPGRPPAGLLSGRKTGR
jgi:hypothetical protein